MTDVIQYLGFNCKKKYIWIANFAFQKIVFVWRCSAYIFHCSMYTITYSEYTYAVLVNQTNMSYSNGVPFAKHASSYGGAGRVDSFSLIFHTPWCRPYTWRYPINLYPEEDNTNGRCFILKHIYFRHHYFPYSINRKLQFLTNHKWKLSIFCLEKWEYHMHPLSGQQI